MPAVAVKVADVEPVGTVTEAGVVSNALLLDKETKVPPGGAALVRETVQTLVAPEARVDGLQPSELKLELRTVIVLPLPVSARFNPVGSVPIVAVTPTAVVLADGAIVRLTAATTPSVIAVEFRPQATHM